MPIKSDPRITERGHAAEAGRFDLRGKARFMSSFARRRICAKLKTLAALAPTS
jgi:hypothetical protein